MKIQTVSVEKTSQSRIKELNLATLEFGKMPADHLFIAWYKHGDWQEARIQPFENLSLSPFALCLHYGQTVFEGLKAYRMLDGSISIFRPDKHHERLNKSLDRMCMPAVPWELYRNGLHQLIKIDQAWVPAAEGASLYIRPFMIASEAKLGVKIADEYLFMIVTSPVQAFFTHSSKPLRVKVETTYVRAAEGGTGYAKCGGNYGSSFYPTQKAKEQGFDQVLWTDGRSNQYIEESGMMNVMFVFDNTLVTPPLSSSILDGITRDSVLTLAEELGMKTEERSIAVQELEERLRNGSVKEAFGVGTAAVVSPIGSIAIGEHEFTVPVQKDAVLFRLRKRLSDIRLGVEQDRYGWNYIIAAER